MWSFTRTVLFVPTALRNKADWSAKAMRLVIIATTLTWLQSGKLLWFLVGAVCTALTFLPAAWIQDPALRTASSLCASTLLFAHVVFGMQAGFYETSTVYDKVVHMLGCSAIAGLVITAISHYCARRNIHLPLPLLLLLAIGIVVSLGTMWEMFEFALDRTGLFQAQRGLTDTMLDLVADLFGALAAMTVFAFRARRTVRAAP